jgi:hypothetical protein
MITPLEIDHIYLYVSNLEKTKNHLKSIFDFKFFQRPNSDKIMAVESKNIHFFIQEGKLPSEHLDKQHISFEIDDLNTIMKKLESMNIDFRSGTFSAFKYKNYNWVEWRDHDGIKWECVQRL